MDGTAGGQWRWVVSQHTVYTAQTQTEIGLTTTEVPHPHKVCHVDRYIDLAGALLVSSYRLRIVLLRSYDSCRHATQHKYFCTNDRIQQGTHRPMPPTNTLPWSVHPWSLVGHDLVLKECVPYVYPIVPKVVYMTSSREERADGPCDSPSLSLLKNDTRSTDKCSCGSSPHRSIGTTLAPLQQHDDVYS